MNQEKPNWPLLIESWESSGLSQTQYCKERGVALSTFQYYRYKAKKSKPSQKVFTEIKIKPANHEVLNITIDSTGNLRVRLNFYFDVKL